MPRLATLALLALVIACGCTRVAPRTGDAERPLIFISIDGFRSDYLDRGRTPTLAELAKRGVRAEALRPSFPTLTFPNHYTLVTGLYPDHHGIVNNRMTDPTMGKAFVYKQSVTTEDPAWWGGEPIWVGAERHGIRSATMFWPGSNVAIHGLRPNYWMPFDTDYAPSRRVDEVLHWLDLPPSRRPRFLTLYFEQVDKAGHTFGPESPEVDAALRETDAALGRLVAGLKRRGIFDAADIVVVSDHGQTATDPAQRTYLDDIVPLDDVEVASYGILAGIEPRPGKTAGVEAALLRPHPHMRCWRKGEMPPRLHYGSNPRIPALLCLADRGGIVSWHGYDARGGHYSAGEHGYDNDEPSMRALFIAHGPAFRSGVVVPEFDNVDVYPLLAHLLGFAPEPNDGDFRAVAPVLRDGK